MGNVWATLKQLKRMILIIAFSYIVSIVAGLITNRIGDGTFVSFAEKLSQPSLEQVEKIFGKYRQSVREGNIAVIALCSLIVFTINTFGNFINFTLPGIFIVPIAATLLFGGWVQGIGLASIQASSFLSLFLYLVMVCLEFITYVFASVAGVNIGLSILAPKRHGVTSRWKSFKFAWGDAGRLYIIITIILAFQAVFEIMYVRKVLLMGGSGIPLAPY